MAEKDSDLGTKNEALLKRIRQRYSYGMNKWSRVRKEGQENMRYVAGDPWSKEEKLARQDRPTVCPDELNQYINQVVNTFRQNPRGVKVDPAGDDATEKLAEYRENRIRAIEYGCNASQVYVNGLQAAVERNLGFWKVTRQYISDETDEQEILILPINNSDSVLIDPDYKESDGSDIKWAFELDRMPLDEFEAEYPDAGARSFSADQGDWAQAWHDDESILVASYWEMKPVSKKSKTGRSIQSRTIQQYVTNGFEILKKGSTQPGPYIPIVPVFGKELWVDYTGAAERVLISLVSLARDPQKALAYVMSSMLEDVGQTPKNTYVGYAGQFEKDSDAWGLINKVYYPKIEVDVVIDGSNGQPLPLPQLTQRVTNFQAYSSGVDICRRAIMSAMGVNALPTQAQRSNQKSGVALEKIQSEQSIGSYHLPDATDRAIRLTGRIINNWLPEVDLGETKRPIRLADGKHKMVPINTDAAVIEGDHEYHFPIADDKGRYQLTISSGPSHESQREEGSELVDTLFSNIQNLPAPGSPAAKMMALGIRIKQLGPLGDQMADILDPPNQSAQQQQQMAQLQQQQQAQGEQLQQAQALIQKLMLERQGRVVEQQGKLTLAHVQHAAAMTEANLDRETKLAVAEITTQAQDQQQRTQTYEDLQAQFHDQAHDVAMQATQQQHEQGMAQVQGQQASAQSAQDAAQQAQVQQSAPPAQGE